MEDSNNPADNGGKNADTILTPEQTAALLQKFGIKCSTRTLQRQRSLNKGPLFVKESSKSVGYRKSEICKFIVAKVGDVAA